MNRGSAEQLGEGRAHLAQALPHRSSLREVRAHSCCFPIGPGPPAQGLHLPQQAVPSQSIISQDHAPQRCPSASQEHFPNCPFLDCPSLCQDDKRLASELCDGWGLCVYVGDPPTSAVASDVRSHVTTTRCFISGYSSVSEVEWRTHRRA